MESDKQADKMASESEGVKEATKLKSRKNKENQNVAFDQNKVINLPQDSAKQIVNERVGDWVCIACENLNFSFRQVCNRCWRDKNDKACVVLMSQEDLHKF